jgi:hypothetical protein
LDDTLSGLKVVELTQEEPDLQESGPAADEQPTGVIRVEGVGPIAAEPEEPQAEDLEVQESEVEPSMAQDERDEALDEHPVSEPEAADEVEQEETSLAEEGSSQEFFDREQGEHSDSRIFRASRFLRRRE